MRQNEVLRHLIGALGVLVVAGGASCLLHAQAPECPRGYQISEYRLDANGKKHIVSCLDSKTGNFWFAARIADSGGQVFNIKAYGAKGDDSHDDTAAIIAAYDAMPSCNIAGTTYTHCGTLYFPTGIYYTSSQITIESAGVTLQGSTNGISKIDAHISTGNAALEYAPHPLGPYQDVSGASFNDLWIDGTNSVRSSRTDGFHTIDAQAMKTRHLSVSNFPGTCWRDDVDGQAGAQAERQDVQMTLTNCVTGWLLHHTAAGGGSTFGYGHFNLAIGVNSGETGIVALGASSTPVEFDQASGLIVVNASNTAYCIDVRDYSIFVFGGLFHCEETAGSGGTSYGVHATGVLRILGGFTIGGRMASTVEAGGSATFGPYLHPETFAQLGRCTAEGQHAWVTDSTTATWGATVTGGGTNHVGVVCDGKHWTVAGR